MTESRNSLCFAISMAMATKRQSAEYRERGAQANASKHQSADVREKEAQTMATKHQSAEYREREAQAKATKSVCLLSSEKRKHRRRSNATSDRLHYVL